MIRDGVVYRLITDHLGSVRLVVNSATGMIAQRLDYNELGAVLSDTNPRFQSFGFAGGLYDADTELVQFGSRDYDPVTGRWISRDRSLFSGGDLNLYRYAAGDPINLADVNNKDVCVHRSRQGYQHAWISFNKDPESTYGAWPDTGDVMWTTWDIEHPDLRKKETNSPKTTTKCYEATPEQDREVEDWINKAYDLGDPSNNPRYVFGFNDCRHFADSVIEKLEEIQAPPPAPPKWWEFWR
jgi:RHS repeat-associated protein